MKRKPHLSIVLAPILIVAGFAIGYYTAPTTSEVEIIEITAPVVANDNNISTAKIDLLTKQLSEAKAKIAQLNEQIDHLLGEDLSELAASEAIQATEAQPERQPRESWDARMERMKADEPDRYAEIMAQREQRAQRRRDFLEERTRSEEQRDDFFANVNIAYMPQKEQEALAGFIAEYQELRKIVENRMQGERPNMEHATQLGMSVLTKTAAIRASLLKATGKEMGFDDKESVEFATTINEIFGATSLMGPVTGSTAFPGRRPWSRSDRR